MIPRRSIPALGRDVSCLGYGAFKLGRNEGTKYAARYELPTPEEATRILEGVLALGIDLIDVAPAYGLAEERVGACIGNREDVLVTTKVGEVFHDGRSTYDFGAATTRSSVHRSLERLQRSHLDLVFVHADADDAAILRDGACIDALDRLRDAGLVDAIGFSGRSAEGLSAALEDRRIGALMVEYHPLAPGLGALIERAGEESVAVFVKKPLASGRIPPREALPFVLARPGVTSAIVGGLDLSHLEADALIAAGHAAQ